MKTKYKRLQYILIAIICTSLGLWLILKNFNQNIVFFYTPTELKEQLNHKNIVRVGGLVVEGSILKLQDGITTEFLITDSRNNLQISYTGIVPNLFREGQGVIAKGKLVNEVFIASELLVKHDENYMPPGKAIDNYKD